MTPKLFQFTLETLVVSILLSLPVVVRCNDKELIPFDASELNAWFNRQVGGRRSSLTPPLAAAERKATVITVKASGGGHFKTVTDAVNSVPADNKNRVIISIAPGNYSERIKIDRNKPYVTLYGDPTNPPVLVSSGTAKQYGTVDSATLITEGDFFSAVNLKVVNSAPRPDGVRKLAQAAALRVSGDGSSFYSCKFYGYQDTVCDDRGRHVFKNCYIEGTVDFIFGSGTSLYLNTELHVIPGDPMAMITAQARKNNDDTGYVFAHCKVTGSGGIAYLGRSWFPEARVVYAYSELSEVVQEKGWSNNNNPQTEGSVFFGEYKNSGPGSSFRKRVRFAKQLSDEEVGPFISMGFVQGSTWLLPPPKFNVGKRKSHIVKQMRMGW